MLSNLGVSICLNNIHFYMLFIDEVVNTAAKVHTYEVPCSSPMFKSKWDVLSINIDITGELDLTNLKSK